MTTNNHVAQPAGAGLDVRETTRRILGLREGDYCYARTCFKRMGYAPCSGCEDFDAIAERVAQELQPCIPPPDVQERARRLAERLAPFFPRVSRGPRMTKQRLAAIIAAEFGGENNP
jgi:hypothetical protein